MQKIVPLRKVTISQNGVTLPAYFIAPSLGSFSLIILHPSESILKLDD